MFGRFGLGAPLIQQYAVAEELDELHARILQLLKRHGAEPTSFQILEPGYQYWFDRGENACIAYAEVGGAWVTVGEPIAAPDDMACVVEAFVADARRAGRRVRFFHVSEAFVQRSGLAATNVGEQPCWDPRHWSDILAGSRSLREQLRRARAKRVRVRVVDALELSDRESPLRLLVEALVTRWLASRGMHEMKFMVLVHPFSFATERRYVVAEQDGQLIGFAAAVPVYARKGWFLEDLVRDPRAPNGTAELLVDAMMRLFESEGAAYATLGLAPLAGEVSPLLSFTRDYTARLYNFAGVRAFKEKLRPHRWDEVFLAYPRGEWGLVALRDVLLAFAPAGLIRFGLNTLVHQRTLATALLALLLVPWTVALATLDTGTWFPSRAIQLAWTAFDVALILLLFALVQRWRPRLSVAVMWLTSLDAFLTLLQVLWWNVFTAQGVLAWTLVVVGTAGPLLASVFFWTTRIVFLRTRLAALGSSQR
jgi:hypothetical protein